MRSIWLAERIEFKFRGKVLDGALCLGDIDNDGEVELVVGNVKGDLAVFKGEELWQSISLSKSIGAIGVGDVMNCGSNVVVIITIDGYCFIYLCLNNAGEKLRLLHKQIVPPNAKGMAIGDVLGDGQTYLIIGFTDRAVGLYRWVQNPTAASLVCLNRSDCPSQIGNICLGKDNNGKNLIYVAQPGRNYSTIDYSTCRDEPLMVSHSFGGTAAAKLEETIVESSVLAAVGKNGATVLTLLDGTVTYIEDNITTKWSVELEHQIFKAAIVSVSPEGGDQIVAASWSGHTFFMDLDGRVVLFELGLPIMGFTAGSYGPKGSAALVYTTFENKVVICCDVVIESFALKSPLAVQSQDLQLAKYSREQLKILTQYLLYDYPKRH